MNTNLYKLCAAIKELDSELEERALNPMMIRLWHKSTGGLYVAVDNSEAGKRRRHNEMLKHELTKKVIT